MVLARTKIVRNSFENVKRHIADIEDSIKVAISKDEIKLLVSKLREIEKRILDIDNLYGTVANLSDKVSHYPEEAIKILAEKIRHNIEYFEKRLDMQESEIISKIDDLKDYVSNSQKKNFNKLKDFFEERLRKIGHGNMDNELKKMEAKIKTIKEIMEMQNKEMAKLKKVAGKRKK